MESYANRIKKSQSQQAEGYFFKPRTWLDAVAGYGVFDQVRAIKQGMFAAGLITIVGCGVTDAAKKGDLFEEYRKKHQQLLSNYNNTSAPISLVQISDNKKYDWTFCTYETDPVKECKGMVFVELNTLPDFNPLDVFPPVKIGEFPVSPGTNYVIIGGTERKHNGPLEDIIVDTGMRKEGELLNRRTFAFRNNGNGQFTREEVLHSAKTGR